MSDLAETSAIEITRLVDGRVARLALRAGRGNVLTREVIDALDRAFRSIGEDARVRAAILIADGKDFSFGASVREHAPDQVREMLPAFVRLFRTIARSDVPWCAAVQGRCLGGALELVLAAQHILVTEDACLGLPEITLGVFPPVAAAVLPLRVSQPVADRLITTGATFVGPAAVEAGLADALVSREELQSSAMEWASGYAKLSGAAVRFATRAARAAWDEALGARLERLEKMYLDELMATADAQEGIAAFLARREPAWVDR